MTFKVGDLVKYYNAYLEQTRYGIVVATGTIGLQWVNIHFTDGETEMFLDTDDIEKIA